MAVVDHQKGQGQAFVEDSRSRDQLTVSLWSLLAVTSRLGTVAMDRLGLDWRLGASECALWRYRPAPT